MFGKMEFFWCHVVKCASSPAERALTLTLTGLHTGENQELVGKLRFCICSHAANSALIGLCICWKNTMAEFQTISLYNLFFRPKAFVMRNMLVQHLLK